MLTLWKILFVGVGVVNYQRLDDTPERRPSYLPSVLEEPVLREIAKSIRLEPGNPAHYVKRAQYLIEMGRYDEALVDANKAVELHGESRGSLFARAGAFHGLGEYGLAAEEMTKLISLFPDSIDPIWFAARGGSFAMLQKKEAAFSDFNRAIGLGPQIYGVYLARADFLKSLGFYEESLWDYTKALELDLANVRALGGRGFVYARLGRRAEAIQDYTEAAKLTPRDLNVTASLAELLLCEGDVKRALKVSTAAKSLENNAQQQAVCTLLQLLASKSLQLPTETIESELLRLFTEMQSARLNNQFGWDFGYLEEWLSRGEWIADFREFGVYWTGRVKLQFSSV